MSICGVLGSLLISSLLLNSADELRLLFRVAFFIVLGAWFCHFLMCLQWIFNKPLNRLLIKIGTFCGVMSFCLFSIPMLITDGVLTFLKAVGLCLVLVFPCLYLIIYIIRQNKNKSMII
jgi:hypothetical protein